LSHEGVRAGGSSLRSPGQRSEQFELEKYVRVNVGEKGRSTHVIPYDAMLYISRRDALESTGLRGSNAPYITACGERVDRTDEQLKLILILLAISRAMQIGISRLEML
jgi:hypothetical protein